MLSEVTVRISGRRKCVSNSSTLNFLSSAPSYSVVIQSLLICLRIQEKESRRGSFSISHRRWHPFIHSWLKSIFFYHLPSPSYLQMLTHPSSIPLTPSTPLSPQLILPWLIQIQPFAAEEPRESERCILWHNSVLGSFHQKHHVDPGLKTNYRVIVWPFWLQTLLSQRIIGLGGLHTLHGVLMREPNWGSCRRIAAWVRWRKTEQ